MAAARPLSDPARLSAHSGWTAGRMLRHIRGLLTEAGIESARHEAALLVGAWTGLSISQIYTHPEHRLDPDVVMDLQSAVDRRVAHEPLAYILGQTDFYGLLFKVGPGVLIPRPDTERLVETTLEQLDRYWPGAAILHVLDTCTGSGCVGISIASQLLKQAKPFDLTLADCDGTALSYAHENVKALLPDVPVTLSHVDLWPDRAVESSDSVSGFRADSASDFGTDSASDFSADQESGLSSAPVRAAHPGYQLITANPPYIRPDVVDRLMPEVAQHEPHLALDGGPDGLDFYRRIIREAPARLARPGLLLLEHGYDQAGDVAKLLTEAGYVDRIAVADYGGHLRVAGGWVR